MFGRCVQITYLQVHWNAEGDIHGPSRQTPGYYLE